MKRALLVLAGSLCFGQAVPVNPTAPLSVPPGVRPTPTGSVIAVHSVDNLQTKYNAASCGDDLKIDAGATLSVSALVLNKQCSAPNWILVEGAGCADGTAPIPTYASTSSANLAGSPPFASPSLTNYATITTSTGVPTISLSDGTPAKYNYLGCLEVVSAVSQFSLIQSTNALGETLASQLADHLMFDRLYVHGTHSTSSAQVIRGMLLAGSNISVINSYISEIYYSGGDAQAILFGLGPGPNLVRNNFLSGSTETLMAGGTDKTPGYSCTIAASPAPTTTTATVNTCIDAASGSVATPVVGTQVMFYTSAGSPPYVPANWARITGNTAGALTFPAISAPPISGAGKVAWGILPNDNTVTGNYFWKDPCWNSANPCYDGIVRSSKDFLETKYGQRWNISGNIFNNTWNGGQNYAFNFTAVDQDNDCPWCTSSDISFKNNIIKNIPGAFVIIPSQNGPGPCPGSLARVLISNNLFWAQGTTQYIAGGKTMELFGNVCLTAGGGVDSLQVVHNTMLGAGTNWVGTDGAPFSYTNLVYQNNITEFDQTRWEQVAGNCAGPSPNLDGIYCVTTYTITDGSYSISNNGIINSGAINGTNGISDSVVRTRYGAMVLTTIYDATQGTNYAGAPFANYSGVNTDYHNYRVTTGPWLNAGSDGATPGVNFTTLDAALGGGPAPTLACPATVTGTVGTPYSSALVASGGTPAYTYAISVGPLPTGLSLNTSTGVISGTPSAAAAFPFTGGVSDASSQTAAASCSITITASSLSCSPKTGLPTPTVEDVLLQTQMAFGAPCTNNLKGSGTCNVIDVQRVTVAAFGGACVIGP